MERSIRMALIIALLVLAMPLAIADDCPDEWSTIQKWYAASKEENLNEFLSQMDLEYINNNLAAIDDYKNWVKAAWETFDTASYEITLLKCRKVELRTMVFFSQTSQVTAEGNSYAYDEEMFASMYKGKIRYIIPRYTFESQMAMIDYANFYAATEQINMQQLNDTEEFLIYADANMAEPELSAMAGSSEGSQAGSAGGESNFPWWLLIVIAIAGAGAFFFLKKKRK